MRAVVQRVDGASVVVDGETVGEITGEGLCVLVGVTHEDTKEKAAQLARKLWSVRILAGEKSCSDVDAPLLVIASSPFTGTPARAAAPPGTRPRPARSPSRWWTRSWHGCGRWARRWRRAGSAREMSVSLTNDGPFTVCSRSEHRGTRVRAPCATRDGGARSGLDHDLLGGRGVPRRSAARPPARSA